MVTIKEIKAELRYREWAEQIQECQSSGISPSTYYNRLREVQEGILS